MIHHKFFFYYIILLLLQNNQYGICFTWNKVSSRWPRWHMYDKAIWGGDCALRPIRNCLPQMLPSIQCIVFGSGRVGSGPTPSSTYLDLVLTCSVSIESIQVWLLSFGKSSRFCLQVNCSIKVCYSIPFLTITDCHKSLRVDPWTYEYFLFKSPF